MGRALRAAHRSRKAVWKMARLRGTMSVALIGVLAIILCSTAGNAEADVLRDPTVAWHYYLVAETWCSPAVADIDTSSPGSEIVIGTTGGVVFCLGSDGSLKWTFTASGELFHPAIANIDDEGPPEVLIRADYVYCLNSDGTERWSFDAGGSCHGAAGLTIANMDTVGHPEILVGGGRDSLYCLNYDGTLRWSYSTGGCVTSPAVANIDEQGTPEVIFGSNDGRVYCLDSDGNFRWSTELGGFLDAVSVADVDLDWEAEIVAVGWTAAGPNMVYCLEKDGSLRWSAQLLSGGSAQVSMAAIDDINDDARPEIVVFSNCEDHTRDSLYALQDDESGANPSFRIVWAAWAADTIGGSATAPIIYDLDGDGDKDVTWEGTNYLRIYNGSDGSTLYENTDFCSRTGREHPAIADIDGDGHAEVVAIYNYEEIAVLESDTFPECRDQFSCYTYHITNINDDLTVPRIERNHWQTHNSWLAQGFLQVHDVGVVSIDSPPDMIKPDSAYSPMATVKNFGDFTESFPVDCQILPIGYWAQTQVDSLRPGEQVQVSFFDCWFPSFECVWYRVAVFSSLTGDVYPGNDTLRKTVLATTHEVGVVSIDEPPDTVTADSTYVPIATVKNFGFVSETLEVECLIDSSGPSIYGDTVAVVDLAPSVSFPCTFEIWTVPPSDSTTYTMTVSLLPSNDCDTSNNSLQKPIFAYCLVVATEEVEEASPIVFSLLQSRPNPVWGATEIVYQIPRDSWVELKIYDAVGRLTRTLVAEKKRAGAHSVLWDGRNSGREKVPSGVYFYRLTAGTFTATNRMVVLR